MKTLYFFLSILLIISCTKKPVCNLLEIEKSNLVYSSRSSAGFYFQVNNTNNKSQLGIKLFNHINGYDTLFLYNKSLVPVCNADIFLFSINSLIPNTNYMVTPFILSNQLECPDTVFQEKINFSTKASYTFKDERDGQEYEYAIIGNQTWMTENLNFKTANSIDTSDFNSSWHNNRRFDLENDGVITLKGQLYTIDDLNNACPDGWHIPSTNEWMELAAYAKDFYSLINLPCDTLLPADLILNSTLAFSYSLYNAFDFNMKTTYLIYSNKFDTYLNYGIEFWCKNNDDFYIVYTEPNTIFSIALYNPDIEINTKEYIPVRCIKNN